jgi:hypothetical protein
MVGLRNSGDVCRMKSFQKAPGSCSDSSSGGGERSTSASADTDPPSQAENDPQVSQESPKTVGLSGLRTLGPTLTLRPRSRTRDGSLLQFRHD